MDQRKQFISAWLKDDWNLTELCEAFGISRPTGYKWIERFKLDGVAGLEDHSRAHLGHPQATGAEIEARIIELRERHPYWGPRKLKARLVRTDNRRWPCSSTIGEILRRRGLVVPRRRRTRTPLFTGALAEGLAPNDVWAADFKGWFKTRDGTRIDPLTVSAAASRYLIRCQAVARTNGDTVRGQLTAAFQEFGLPNAIRTDNGPPFATVGVGGLSELSAWLIRLGVMPQRIRPAHPEENGAHERMHRTLKQETASPPKANFRSQQAAFESFQREYNEIRPHEAIGMKTPGDMYSPSTRAFPAKLPEIEYPEGALIRNVAANGTISFKDKMTYVSNALRFQRVRLEELEDGWYAWFGPIQLGKFDRTKESLVRVLKV